MGSCNGVCLNLFSKIHQHGPLFNYGPYYGYPPFEPYGPWDAYLQYNPWYYGDPNARGGNGNSGHGGRLGGLFHGSHGCSGCGLAQGWHASWLHGGWFQGRGATGCHSCHGGGLKGLLHGRKSSSISGTASVTDVAGGCSSCHAAFDPAADPLDRFTGVGSPITAAAYYSGLPAIVPVGQ